MAMDEMSPQRKSAYYRWRQAQQELQKGHAEKAVELARTALEEDPEYLDIRLWLARHFAAVGDNRHAARELEEVIHIQRANAEAWDVLRKIDPASAARLERLGEIAPDPFVNQRKVQLTDDLGSMDDLESAEGAGGPEYAEDLSAPRAIGDDPFVSGASLDEFDDMEEVAHRAPAEATRQVPAEWAAAALLDDDPEPEPEPEPAPRAPAPPAHAGSGYAWEYDQDRSFLARWQAEKVVAGAVARLLELWREEDKWDSVLSLCAHADKQLHPAIYDVSERAAETLEVKRPTLFVFPERCMHPVIIKDRQPVLAVPTGLIRAMKPEEMLFQIGRETGHLHTGYVAEMQVVKIITNRKSQLAGDLAGTLRDFMSDNLKGWDAGVSKEEMARLKKLGHAWQQRCELTADRAGLLCCGDIGVACAAMSKTTAKSVDDAAITTPERFLKQFEGQDVGSLAAIGVEQTPSRDPQYVAYRIHMLRWWASTPEYKALVGG
jgi:hypothetical protein